MFYNGIYGLHLSNAPITWKEPMLKKNQHKNAEKFIIILNLANQSLQSIPMIFWLFKKFLNIRKIANSLNLHNIA